MAVDAARQSPAENEDKALTSYTMARYLQQNNYLGAIRNFIIDITLADPFSSICGIHWQVKKIRCSP